MLLLNFALLHLLSLVDTMSSFQNTPPSALSSSLVTQICPSDSSLFFILYLLYFFFFILPVLYQHYILYSFVNLFSESPTKMQVCEGRHFISFPHFHIHSVYDYDWHMLGTQKIFCLEFDYVLRCGFHYIYFAWNSLNSFIF